MKPWCCWRWRVAWQDKLKAILILIFPVLPLREEGWLEINWDCFYLFVFFLPFFGWRINHNVQVQHSQGCDIYLVCNLNHIGEIATTFYMFYKSYCMDVWIFYKFNKIFSFWFIIIFYFLFFKTINWYREKKRPINRCMTINEDKRQEEWSNVQ